MRIEDKLLALVVVTIALIIIVGLVAIGVWSWQDASDKRACRRSGGAVSYIAHGEWHCVGSTPEAR